MSHGLSKSSEYLNSGLIWKVSSVVSIIALLYQLRPRSTPPKPKQIHQHKSPIILEQYPVDILWEIFEYLSPSEVCQLTNDAFVGEFARANVYHHVMLLPQDLVEKSDDNGSGMYLDSLLTLVERYPEFRGDHISIFLSLEELLELDTLYPYLLARFKNMVIPFDVNFLELLSLFKFRNLTTVHICDPTKPFDRFSFYPLPQSVTELGISEMAIDCSVPPHVKDLRVVKLDNFQTSHIPENLEILYAKNLDSFVFDKNLPKSLKSLSIQNNYFIAQIEIPANISYLENLTMLILTDISWTPTELPPNLVHLKLTYCSLFWLHRIKTLTKLKEFEATNVVVLNWQMFQVEFPASLRSLVIRQPIVIAINQANEQGLFDRNIFSTQLPPMLEEFELTSSDTYIDGNLTYPSTLKHLVFKNLDGAHYADTGLPSTIIRDTQFPETLELLDLTGCKFTQVMNTNLGNLPKLEEIILTDCDLDLSSLPLAEILPREV